MSITKRLREKGVKERVRDGGSIVYSTEARGLRTISYVADRMAPSERKAQEEATRVVRSQPHRRGSTDRMAESPLGRFCTVMWPVRPGETIDDINADHRNNMFQAGMRYHDVVHRDRVMQAIANGRVSAPETLTAVIRTDDELIEAMNAAKMARIGAQNALRKSHRGALSAMDWVVVDHFDARPGDDCAIYCGLFGLAVHFSIIRVVDILRRRA